MKLRYATTMNIGNIMLSESQIQKDKYSMITFISGT